MLNVGAKSGKRCRIHLYTTVNEINYTTGIFCLLFNSLSADMVQETLFLHLFIRCATFSLNVVYVEI